MGGSSGGGQQTTVQKNEPPAYLQPYYTDVAQQAQSLYQQGAPAYYPGQTVANQGDATLQALQSIKARAGGAQPLQTGAEAAYENVLNPDYLDVTKDPLIRGAMDYANQGTIEQFRDATLPGIASTFSQAGRLSSGAVGNTVGNSEAALARTLAGSNNSILFNASNQRRADQLATAAAAPALAAAGYAPAQTLAAAGGVEDSHAQDVINADIQKYNYNANAEKLSLQDYINLLQGTTGNQGVSTSTASGPSSNNFLGTASSVAGTAAALASLAALSDRRLKVDIRKVGKLANGLNLYEYAYSFAPHQRLRGVMADEVMAVKPEAVSRHASGFLMVDYGAL